MTQNQPTKKLLALDLDGTLLNDQHAISQRSAAKLHELALQDVVVVLASGRSGPAMYHLVESLKLPAESTYTVAYNGAIGYRFPSGFSAASAQQKEVVFEQPLDSGCVDFLIAFAQREGLLAQVYVGDEIFVCCKSDEHFKFAQRYTELTSCKHTFIDDDYEAVPRNHVPKCLLMTDDPDTVAAKVKAAMMSHGVTATIVRGSPPFFVEVLNDSVCKGAGLQRLCKMLGFELSQVVAFGDGDNDVEMLRMVGLGVAMANARPTLKAVADRITSLTNDDDGVAACIQELQAEGLLPLPDDGIAAS